MSLGMNAQDGTVLTDNDHLRQSIGDILTTPIGSRVMRREYGSMIPTLLDAPLVEATLLRVYTATVMALWRWEPRLRITAVRHQIDTQNPGRLSLEIEGTTTAGTPVTLEVPVS